MGVNGRPDSRPFFYLRSMLRQLAIQNYAIIDELDIRFSGHFNVITGETGAGKSIIMGALGLILGERADSSVLVNKEKKCIVEGFFHMTGQAAVREFLLRHELDTEEELVIRREIAVNGKSRAFINDTPVNLTQLQELSSLLVDLHQQFDTLAIGESDFQREVIDALAGDAAVLGEYRIAYDKWKTADTRLSLLREEKVRADKDADYNRFQYNELEEADLKENELEEIDASLRMLGNAEGIKSALSRVYFELDSSETPIVQQLKSMINQLQPFVGSHASLEALIARLQSAQIELQDIADETDRISDAINYDPARIEEMSERLSLGYRLQKKHGVNSTNELLAIRTELAGKLDVLTNIDQNIEAAEAEVKKYQQEAGKLAAKITSARKAQAAPLSAQVNKLLAQVGMPNAALKVELKPVPLHAFGADLVEFLFDANKSGQFQPVRKVASGGELSRLMLCIKSLVAASIDLPTMIFDEIDTGISGEAARQVGLIMRDLAKERQLICITHQPQIAGKADAHYFVYKDIVKNSVKTNIRRLETDERITAIARMLSGEKPTAAAMENAREMVAN